MRSGWRNPIPATPAGSANLSVSYSELGDTFRKAGDKTKSLDALRQGQAIMGRLTRSTDNAVWKRLAGFDGQIAELGR